MDKPKPSNHKLLLALPNTLRKELQEEADKDIRSFNNYVTWVLVNRHKNKPE